MESPTRLQDLMKATKHQVLFLETGEAVVEIDTDVLIRGAYRVDDLQEFALAMVDLAHQAKLYAMITKWLTASGLTRDQVDAALEALYQEEKNQEAKQRLFGLVGKGLFG